jgi:hypothetical protein
MAAILKHEKAGVERRIRHLNLQAALNYEI